MSRDRNRIKLVCPHCGNESPKHVIDSRYSSDKNAIRRRRECEACGMRITTYEVIAKPGDFDLMTGTAPAELIQAVGEAAKAIATIQRVLRGTSDSPDYQI